MLAFRCLPLRQRDRQHRTCWPSWSTHSSVSLIDDTSGIWTEPVTCHHGGREETQKGCR